MQLVQPPSNKRSRNLQIDTEKLIQLGITLPVLVLFTHDVIITIASIHQARTNCTLTNICRALTLLGCVGFIARMWLKTLVTLVCSDKKSAAIHNYNILQRDGDKENRRKRQ
jgi:hypothetical protein